MAGILDIGVSALNAYQRSLNLTGHNVANVNTPGYSRQRTQTIAQDPSFMYGSYVGNGVASGNVERIYDEFLVGQVRTTQSITSDLEIFYKFAGQIDNVIADPDVGLDAAVQDFFDSLQGLADDPGGTPVRELLLAESQAMTDRFHFLDRTFEAALNQAHGDMQIIVNEINDLSKTVAELNYAIANSPGIHQGHWPNDLLDQRDQAVNALSQYVSVSTLGQDDGTVSVYFGKGQPLVLGTEYNRLSVIDSPEISNHKEIAYGSDKVTNIISNQIGGGELGGLLRTRDDILEQGRNRLGLVALGLSFEINAQHREGINLSGQTGLDFFTDLSTSRTRGNKLNDAATDYLFDVTVTDPAKLPAIDFALQYNGGAANDFANYSLFNLSDGELLAPAAPPVGFPWDLSADLGLSIDLNAGTSITAGDRFFFSPSANVSNRLELAVRDPEDIAAASPITTVANPGNTGGGMVSLPSVVQVTAVPVQLTGPVSLTFSNDLDGNPVTSDPGFVVAGGPGGTLSYDPATQSRGQTLSLDMGGYHLEFVAAGQPAVGDSFVIDNGTVLGVADNRNALLLADLQSWRGMLNGTASFQDTFANYVAEVGSKTRQANVNLQAQQRLLELNTDNLESVKGVNLDEEAANLVRFQQAYQAAAQVISTANTLFDSLIAAVR